MVLYAIKNVQLDSHGDIRGRHLPRLLRHILSSISDLLRSSFSTLTDTSEAVQFTATLLDTLIAMTVVCRYLLAEINQNNVSNVFESIQQQQTDVLELSPSRKGVKCNRELAEGNIFIF
jgi:hypothetical protein